MPIVAVTIEGRHRTSHEDIRTYLRSHPPGRYTRANLDSDMVALHDTGLFWQVGAEPVCRAGEVTIRVILREWPLIKAVGVKGTKCTLERGPEVLAGLLDEVPGRALSFGALALDRQKLQDECRVHGHRVEVRPVVSFVGPNEVEVTFELQGA